MLAHVGWPTVGLAIVILIGRAIRDKDQTRRLIGLIVVLVAVVVGSVAICVELLGMQVPGFHVAAMTRAAAPVATASPRPAPPVAADPVATASPSASGVYPDESGRRARSVQQSRRAAAPPATRPARIRSGSPTPRVRASRSPGRWARAGLQRDVRSLQSGGPRLVTIWPWPRSRRPSNLQVRRRTSILPRYTCPALTATVTVPACCARLAVPDAIAEQLAHQQGGVIPVGVPGTEHPDCERAGDPCPLGPPGHRHALPDLQPSHQRTRLPRPPPPPANHRGRQAGCTGMHARLSGSRQAGARDRRGPSVAVRGKPTVHTDRPRGRTPSAICPWTPRHSGPQRYKVTHDGTEKKRPA